MYMYVFNSNLILSLSLLIVIVKAIIIYYQISRLLLFPVESTEYSV